MKPQFHREVLDGALQTRVPEDVNLLPQIAGRFMKAKSAARTRNNFILGFALALLALMTTLFIWPDAANAMRRLIGYIPGLGMVEPGNSLRVLAEPVMVEGNGITVTVEKGTADPQRTILRISVNGINAVDITSAEGMGSATIQCENWSPLLRLKDGTTLETSYGVNSLNGYSGYTFVSVFPALPAESDDVILEIPCLWQWIRSEKWEITLHFVPSDGSGLDQLIEIPPVPPIAQSADDSPYGISLVLDKVVTMEDGYLLMGRMLWSDAEVSVNPYNPCNDSVFVIDGDGKKIALENAEEVAPDLLPSEDSGGLSVAWAYKVPGKRHTWPLRLKMDAEVTIPADVSFIFDPGSDPQPGQVWKLDQDLMINGHAVRLVSATWMDFAPGTTPLYFAAVSADPVVTNLHISDRAEPMMCSGGGGGGTGEFIIGIGYCEPMTPGPRKLTIDSITVIVSGPWQVTWQPQT